MGFELSATHIIFFVAAISLSVVVAGTMQSSVGRVTGKIDDRSQLIADELTTDIAIINDVGNMPNNPVVLYVLNTGTRTLDPTSTVAIVDGTTYVGSQLVFDVLDSTTDEVWYQGQTLSVTVDGLLLGSGDHRAKVSVEHGISDTIRFHIT